MRTIRRLNGDERGTILVFVAIALAVLLGFVALSFDMGRMAATQTELQSFADNTALAVAGELDGGADAITRAQAAATAMIQDSQTFGVGGQTLDVNDITLTFLTTLPGNDSNVDATSAITTDPAKAAFVRVDVTPHEVPMAFASAFAVLSNREATEAEVAATATAGFTTWACDITALMFCVPPGFDADAEVGSMIHLRDGGGETGQWGPGNFGFLRPSGGLPADPDGPCKGLQNDALDRCLLAAENPVTTCFQQRGVDMRPGHTVGGMAAAFNVRFDLYASTMLSERRNPAYAPAPSVISGKRVYTQGGGANPMCHIEDSTNTVPLPRDDCFATSPSTCGRFGDGDFSDGLVNYIATNYGTAPAWFPTNPATRYQIYLAEIAAAGSGDILSNRDVTGRAVCHRSPSDDPDRRVLVAAGIDCAANRINGAKTDVPVSQWVKLFLTEPADPSTKDIFVEVIGSAEGEGHSGIIHDVVQLYR